MEQTADMSQNRTFFLLLATAVVCLVNVAAAATEEGCDACLCISRTIGGTGTYAPWGGTLDITVSVSNPGVCAVTALAIRETLPSGWTFDGMVVSGPAFVPAAGDSGTLEFDYVAVPTFPFSFTYRVLLPVGESGTVAVSGNSVYRTNGGEVTTPEFTTLIPEPRTVEVIAAGGTVRVQAVCGSDCLGDVETLTAGVYAYPAGTTLQLSPAAETGYAFDRWLDDASGCEEVETVILDEDRSVTALFALAWMLTVNVTPADSASINVNLSCGSEGGFRALTPVQAGVFEVPEGRQVNVTVVPAQEERFVDWAEDWIDSANKKSNPLSLTMSADSTLTARLRSTYHSADYNADEPQRQWVIDLSELLRVIQLYNSKGYHCSHVGDSDYPSQDGYSPGTDPAWQGGVAHDADCDPQDWNISLTEVLRIIQFYTIPRAGYCTEKSYHYCPDAGTEDGFCPGGTDMPSEGECQP